MAAAGTFWDTTTSSLRCGHAVAGTNSQRPGHPEAYDGRLVLAKTTVAPGEVARFRVKNLGERPLRYGTRYRLEHLEGDAWSNAKADFFGKNSGWTLQGFSTAPGELGPGGVIEVPDDLADGRYRVVRTGSDRLKPGGVRLPLCSEFVVAS